MTADAGRVLVVGAGVAGLSAATALGRAGVQVLVVDQALAPGGSKYRQRPRGKDAGSRDMPVDAAWTRVMARLSGVAPLVELRCNTRYCGVDVNGRVLLTDGSGVCSQWMTPRAVVLGTGARERVQPRAGWTLPGVMTAGAIQVGIKMTGQAPAGQIVLAGSGPLLLAVGALLVRLGRPPVAIVEAGNPWRRPWRALGLPPSYLAEALACFARLRVAGVPLLTNAHATRIEAAPAGRLWVTVDSGQEQHRLACDQVGLHDGIASNDYGPSAAPGLIVRQAGDCREALGARAAEADGRQVGMALAAVLTGRPEPAGQDGVAARERRAQARLSQLFAHDGLQRLAALPGDTVVCRCEQRTIDDLRILGPAPTTRQLRLNGRFAMGACQGRFCAEWVATLADPANGAAAAQLQGARWPARPVSIAALLAADADHDSAIAAVAPSRSP